MTQTKSRPPANQRVGSPTRAAFDASERIADFVLALLRSAPSRWQELGITPQQLRFLLELSALGSARPMRLAERMDIHVSTLTGITDRLVERALVSRRPAVDDRRCFDLSLTDEGQAMLRELLAGQCGALDSALDRLDAGSLRQLGDLLAALTATLEARVPDGGVLPAVGAGATNREVSLAP